MGGLVLSTLHSLRFIAHGLYPAWNAHHRRLVSTERRFQLGIKRIFDRVRYAEVKCLRLDTIVMISADQHHTLTLTADGHLHLKP